MVDLRLVVSSKERRFYLGDMDKDLLIGYCSIHCETPRALFSAQMIAQMIEYAGCPENYPSPKEVMKGFQNFYPLHESMKELVDLARERGK